MNDSQNRPVDGSQNNAATEAKRKLAAGEITQEEHDKVVQQNKDNSHNVK